MPEKSEKSLVLVVGAGASKEVNLPVGTELKQQIAKVLDIRYEHGYQKVSGDDVVNEAIRQHVKAITPDRIDVNPYLHAGWRIRDAMPLAISIDNFIDSHKSDEKIALCGKLSIARCILAAETRSSLYVDRSNTQNKIKFAALDNSWFNAFFQLLTENCQQEDLQDRLSKVAIVCFNYDRCIEHYLHSALQNYYSMTSEAATAAMSTLEIHHPYGVVGKLPWQHGGGVEFGFEPRPSQLLALAQELRTFTEGVDPKTSDISAIRSTLRGAHRIAILGFAFHRLNIELLFPGLSTGTPVRSSSVYSTAYGISPADIQVISEELSNVGAIERTRIVLRSDLQCSQLLREYRRSLSLS